MPNKAQWSSLGQSAALKALWLRLSEPKSLKGIQFALFGLLIWWLVSSVVTGIWALYPRSEISVPTGEILNPALPKSIAARSEAVALETLLGTAMFGQGGSAVAVTAPEEMPVTETDGIERGAKETSLNLTLTGILALGMEGQGSAIIEARNEQIVYAVGDKLPVGNNVKLAKVMPKQVVLDNNGRYELLTLYEGDNPAFELIASDTSSSSVTEEVSPRPSPQGEARSVKIEDPEAVALASSYREKMYQDPKSLSKVAKVSSVMRDGKLYGYRVAPGSDPQAFRALGFESGDIIVAVNGLSLSDPANAVRLYQTMKDETAASVDVDRGGSSVSIDVSLSDVQ